LKASQYYLRYGAAKLANDLRIAHAAYALLFVSPQVSSSVHSAYAPYEERMIRRRLRGLLAMVTGGAVAGGIAGAALGMIFLLMPGPKVITIQPQFPGAIVIMPALWLGVAGATAGGAFATLLMLAEGGRSIDTVRIHRVALLAAAASAPAIRLVGWSWTTVALGSMVSAAIGATAMWLAKRSAPRAIAGQLD
jgi:hypothetical protein